MSPPETHGTVGVVHLPSSFGTSATYSVSKSSGSLHSSSIVKDRCVAKSRAYGLEHHSPSIPDVRLDSVVGLAARQSFGLPSIREVPRFRGPLPVPPVLIPVRSDATGDYYELAQREGAIEIFPGIQTRVWGYNGAFPGPTIRARRGKPVFVTHTNRLSVPTVVHLHGGVTRPESDGFPTDTIAPGDTRCYEYANTGPAATLWYHDHSRTGTGRNLYMGLAGLYLLEDDAEINALLPRDGFDIPLILQDRAFADDGQFGPTIEGIAAQPARSCSSMGRRGPFWRSKPGIPVRPECVKCDARALALSPARPLIQIAADRTSSAASRVAGGDVTMAERVEVVIDFSSYPWEAESCSATSAVKGPGIA